MIGFDDVVEMMAISSAVASVASAIGALIQKRQSSNDEINITVGGKEVDLHGINSANIEAILAQVKSKLVEEQLSTGSRSSRQSTDVAG